MCERPAIVRAGGESRRGGMTAVSGSGVAASARDDFPAVAVSAALGAAALLSSALGAAALALPTGADLSVRPEMRAVAAAATLACLVISACWFGRPWPTRRASAAAVLCADALVAIFPWSLHSSSAALPFLTLFATVGCYVAAFHGSRLFVAHQSFATATVFALAGRAAMEDGDTVRAFIGASLAVTVSFSAPVMARSLIIRLRVDAGAAAYDPLTGVHNRRGAAAAAGPLFCHARLLRLPTTAIVIDIDSFKTINDTYGHHIGDLTLELTAQSLRRHFPSPAIVTRTGGEEFAVLTPGRGVDTVSQLRAFGLDAALQTSSCLPDGADHRLTYSIGAVEIPADHVVSDASDIFDELLRAADAAMYVSKRTGGNRITVTEPGHGEQMTVKAIA